MNAECRRLAAKYIRRQARQLAEQLDGVRAAEDIEYVHRARVATRRLRAALRMFGDCFPRKRLRRWRRAIRRVTASLGDARDRDVQIEWLCGALADLNARECFPGVARVLVRLERDRERLQRRVVKAANRIERRGTLQEMRRESKKILKHPATTPADPSSPDVCGIIKRHVVRQLNRLLEIQDCLFDPDDRRRHHAMRIAAKRLRYVLEIARPAFEGRLNRTIEAIKRVQTLLGDVHDCDVWLDHLDAFAAGEQKRLTALFGHAGRFLHLRPGIEFLRADRHRRRQAVFAELLQYWDELNSRGFWSELLEAVSAAPAVPAEAPCDSASGESLAIPPQPQSQGVSSNIRNTSAV